MPTSAATIQRTQALALLKRRGMTRLAEFSEAGTPPSRSAEWSGLAR